MAVSLSEDDFHRLTQVLSDRPEWRLVHDRESLVREAFTGSARGPAILRLLNLDGRPRPTAVRVITDLAHFGQDGSRREALGALVTALLRSAGGGDDADFLQSLLEKYPHLSTSDPRAQWEWHGTETNESVLEKIIGENTLRDIAMLEILLEMSQAVVRIQIHQEFGTGFLIANDLVLTNNHVIPNEDAADHTEFQFFYQVDRHGKERLPEKTRRRQGGLFHTSPYDINIDRNALDYTIVQIANVPKNITPLYLNPKATPQPRERVTIIQHPKGTHKKISLQNNFVEYVDQHVVQYTTSTQEGSSGSPVIDESFAVVALHHAGGILPEPTTKRRYFRNEGIRVSTIIQDLQQNRKDLFQKVAKTVS